MVSKQLLAKAIITRRKALNPPPVVVVVDGEENVEAEQAKVCEQHGIPKDAFLTIVLVRFAS